MTTLYRRLVPRPHRHTWPSTSRPVSFEWLQSCARRPVYVYAGRPAARSYEVLGWVNVSPQGGFFAWHVSLNRGRNFANIFRAAKWIARTPAPAD